MRRSGRERARQLWQQRWSLILPFVAAATLLAAPASCKKPSRVDADLKVSDAEFSIGGQSEAELVPEVQASVLTAFGFAHLEFVTGVIEVNDPATRSWQPAPTGTTGKLAGGTD